MDKITRAFSGDSDSTTSESAGFAAQLRDSTTLGWTSRIKGFAICFGLAFLSCILGTFFLFIPIKGLRLFAIFYSLGNIMAVSSTSFLIGPLKQVKKMFDPTRILATLVTITFLILTLISALYLKKTGLTIVCCLIQFVAMTWYCLSYIPFARDAVRKVLQI